MLHVLAKLSKLCTKCMVVVSIPCPSLIFAVMVLERLGPDLDQCFTKCSKVRI